jgi:hypothetical protein
MPYYKTFKVSGQGMFPAEMLSIEQVYPSSVVDSKKIQRDNPRNTIVELVAPFRYKTWSPSYSMWNAFGWKVMENSLTCLKGY